MRVKFKNLGMFLTVLLVMSTSPALAQVSEKEKAEKEAERKQILKRKTLVLVDEIATGALSLKLPENRTFVLTSAAELLWAHDEKRARSLFWDALGSLNLLAPAPPAARYGNKASSRGKTEELEQYFARFAQRQLLLRAVARRDPDLALEMMRASRQQIPEQIQNLSLPDDSDLEQQIAAEAVARDPERALQLARQSLAKGLSFELLNLLYQLNQKDSEAGSKFAGEMIDKIQSRNLSTDRFASRIAVDLLVSSRPASELTVMKVSAAARPRVLELDKEKRRQLVDQITNAALGISPNPSLLYSIPEIMPEVQEFAPERRELLERKLAAFNQTLNKEQRGWNDYNSVVRTGTPEDMLRAAASAADDQRNMLQQQAVVIAVLRQRADALREIINTEIEDESRRKSLTDMLDAEQIDSAINQGNADDLRKLLPQVRLKEERARAMAEIAILLEKKGDHEEALKLLDEAHTLIKHDLQSLTQTNALFTLLAAYALVEPAKAFAILERTIDRANDDITKLLLLDKILKSGVIKKGEIMMQNSGMISFDFAMFKYGKGVKALANADFDRTKAAADRLTRNELRILARLMLAQALLRSEPTIERTDEN